jgi:hypothetical protein
MSNLSTSLINSTLQFWFWLLTVVIKWCCLPCVMTTLGNMSSSSTLPGLLQCLALYLCGLAKVWNTLTMWPNRHTTNIHTQHRESKIKKSPLLQTYKHYWYMIITQHRSHKQHKYTGTVEEIKYYWRDDKHLFF